MSKNSETGHAKNVANFGILVSFCTGYGAEYNPSNSDIAIDALATIQTDSQNAVNTVNSALPAYNNAIAAREVSFKPLSKLITRVINALKAANPGTEIIDKAVTLVRKLQGRRASSKLTEEEKQELIAQGKEVNEISSSQLSFDNRIDNLDKLINLLGSITEYNPNETELQVASLTALLEDLRTKNDAAIAATTPLSNARIARNNILYNNGAGLVDNALNVKAYVKSLYGASSPQYHQISGLEFKRYKI
jgi:hypothetical protein